MYGLVKLAAEAQDINLNNRYMTREDRLMDQIEEHMDEQQELESQRDPAALAERDRLFANSTLKGMGIGGVIGTGAGAFARQGLSGVALGALAGTGLGMIPGAIHGSIKGEEYYRANENPELLQNIAKNENSLYNSKQRLERHYLAEDRIREAEADRKRRIEERKQSVDSLFK